MTLGAWVLSLTSGTSSSPGLTSPWAIRGYHLFSHLGRLRLQPQELWPTPVCHQKPRGLRAVPAQGTSVSHTPGNLLPGWHRTSPPQPSPAPSVLITSGRRRLTRTKGASQTGREFQAGPSQLDGQGDSWGRSPGHRNWGQQLTRWVRGAGGPGWDSPQELRKVSLALPGSPPPATDVPGQLLPPRADTGSCPVPPAPGGPWPP